MTGLPLSKINLNDKNLFGNDAAEDEQEDVFRSVFVDRKEIANFLNEDAPFLVLRAYRGEGKSAILRRAITNLQSKNAIAIKTTGPSLSPDITPQDPAIWTKLWKQQILGLLASEIGAQIGMAWTDDSISLVEEAEKNGFRSRSIISAIFDRLKGKSFPEKTSLGVQNPEKVVQRWLQNQEKLWLFVDDIDENFVNTPEMRARVASFFSACRQITNLIPEIRIRTGIRPNIWQIARADAESLGKVDQYVVDIRWDIPQMRSILARRIEGYLERTKQQPILQYLKGFSGSDRDEQSIGLCFEKEMEWGFNQSNRKPIRRPPHVVMSTLSRLRPRWMIELARLAAARASGQDSPIVYKKHIVDVLDGFGKTRINDLSSEYRSECPQIREIVTAFADCPEDYTTAELQSLITNKVLTHLDLPLSWKQPMKVASFLYEIGFLTAREQVSQDEYRHYTFAEVPELLHNRTNVDRGMTWEIHPVFRQTLGMRTASGQKKDSHRKRR